MRILLVLLTVYTLTAGDAKPISKKGLPAPVLAAVKRGFPFSKLRACSIEKQGGRTCYELRIAEGKIERNLVYMADGSVIEIGEIIRLDSLPVAVTASFGELCPKAMVRKTEKVIRAQDVLYRITIMDGEKTLGLLFNAEGKLITRE